MPSLAAYRDNDELDNAIADKTIVYVEGPDDVAFFTNLVGPDIRDRLEFKTPEAGTGYQEVKKRVAELRPANTKVHGLLDGEAAVALGQIGAFIDCGSELFVVDDALLGGLVFLAENEIENLLLCHTDLSQFIVNDVGKAELGTRKEADVHAVIGTLALRYVLLSVIKFTMIGFHSEDTPCKGFRKIGGQFISKNATGVATLMRQDVQPAIGAQVAWKDFLIAMHAVVKMIASRHEAWGLSNEAKRRDALRIADGKLLLGHLKSHFKGHAKWDGHLHDQLVRSDYSDRFRKALLLGTKTPRRPDLVALPA